MWGHGCTLEHSTSIVVHKEDRGKMGSHTAVNRKYPELQVVMLEAQIANQKGPIEDM